MHLIQQCCCVSISNETFGQFGPYSQLSISIISKGFAFTSLRDTPLFPLSTNIIIFMLITLVSLLLPSSSLCGTIFRPAGVSPIWNSVANANVQAQYIFSFILETYLPANSQLEVVFPLQYASGLGMGTQKPSCVPSCTLTARSVLFNFADELRNGTTYTAEIQPVTNPASQGGTANFVLRTKRGSNVIDENLIFGIIGIADKIQRMVFGEVVVNPTGSLSAGDYTQYLLKFKTSTTINYESYMLFTIPNEFTLEPFPICSTYPINGITLTGNLFCSQVNQTNQIRITGIRGQITGLIDYAIMLSMRNPKYAGITGSFKLGIYKENTQMMFEEVDGITGVTIVAAQLQNVSMTKAYQYDNSMSRLMDYVIKFTPKFPIPRACNIKIVFPVNMQIVVPTDFNQRNQFQMHYVNYGLEDISEESTIQFLYLDSIQNFLRITNFKEMTMTNEIAVTIRVINPSIVGYTTPLKIYVFQDITEYQLLQSDVLYALTSVSSYLAGNQNVPSPNPAIKNQYNLPRQGFFPHYLDVITTPSPLLADQQTIAQLVFNIDPSQTVPSSGYIILKVPQEFQLLAPTLATQCAVFSLATASYINAAVCTADDHTLTLQLPTNYAFDIFLYPTSETPVAGVNQHRFRLQNLIVTPALNGTYFFDITTYDTDKKTILDTYSHPVVVTANLLQIFSLQSIPVTQGLKAILQISFTTLLAIPSSQVQYRASDLRGFVELHFGIQWAADLGTGLANQASIPCYGVNSLIPYEGNQLKCILRHRTTADPPIVVVSNFREITINTKVKLMISGVTNPTVGSHTVTIKVFKKENRIYTLLNTASSTGTLLTQPGSTVVAACATSPSYSENRVGFLFDMSISLCIGKAIAPATNILIQLPIYDTGFIQIANTVTCSIGILQVYCIPLVGSDFVLIVTPSSTIPMTPQPVFKISNLQWPRYVQSFATYNLLVFVMLANYNLDQRLTFSSLQSCVPGLFENTQVLVPFKGKGFVDASYTFQLTPQSDIPEGSTIVLEFPTFYDFLGGRIPTFTVIGLRDQSLTTKVSTQVNIRLIKISGFKLQPKGNRFIIRAESVRNSASFDKATGFNVYVLYLDKFVLQNSNFFSFEFTTPFKPGRMVINQITASILNADEVADYYISFTPQNDIPTGALIKVTFPSENYKKLPVNPECRVAGGITTFESCILNGKTFLIKTIQRYYAGNGVIMLTIRSVDNPDQGVSEGFIIETEFEGVSLDLTDQSTLNGRTFTTAKKTSPINVLSMTFDPQNEGEEAAYTFTFVSNSFLNSTSEIHFKFPLSYDPALGRDLQCIVFSGLIGGSYQCTTGERMVILKGFDSYTPDLTNPIKLTIFGIVNPNVNLDGSPTDYLKIYIKQANSNIYDESNSEVKRLSFLTAPGWSPLQSITISNFNARWNSTYNFSFVCNQNIPKKTAKGAVLIDYPAQFEIPDGSIICSSSTTFATSLKCNSYRNRVTADGNFFDFVGAMFIRLKSVLNPIEEGITDFLYVRTYDGLNFKIIERNFANLDPFKYTFKFPGPLIKVNSEKDIQVERGTQVIDVSVSIALPCILNLFLVPSESSLFTISPQKVPIKLGMTATKFNISVPQSVPDGTYKIYWTLENELDPLYYTPVKRTQLIVTKKQGVVIAQNPILAVPVLGDSLLTEYHLQNPPDTQLRVTLYLQRAYFGIKLDRANLTVQPGQQKFGFKVQYDRSVNNNGSQVERGFVILELTGINKDIYTLKSPVEFFIITQDTKIPVWVQAELAEIKKTSVQLVVGLDEPCVIYYLVALNGTAFPTIEQFESGLVRYPSTLSSYGYQVTLEGNKAYKIKLDKLYSETNYVVHLLAVDRGNNQAAKRSLYFTTEIRPNSCYFTLIFNQKVLSADFIRNVTEILAKSFGLETTYVQQQKYYLANSRLLQNSFTNYADEIKSYLDLELAAVNDSDSYPEPYDVIGQIKNKTTSLTSSLPTLNLTVDISAYRFIRYVPRFIKQPRIVFIDHQQCALQVALSNYGWGFGVAVKFESSKQEDPTPQQIMMGLDYQNRPTPNGKIELSQSYQDFILNIFGLQEQQDYLVYVIGGSVHFLHPDLMKAEDIYRDRIISFKAPTQPRLNIGNGGNWLEAAVLLCLLWL